MNMTGKILIVDDEASGIATLESMLEGQGYELQSARNGESALNLAEQTLPDLILLDVMMPGMDGFEVCRRIRATPILAEVPIIILTALDDYNSRIAGLEAGADDFFSKPLDRQDLRARVKTITRLNRYRTLLEQRDLLRGMAGRVVEAQEKERQRISRDLHDDLGQSLTALMLNLQNLENNLPLPETELRARLETMLSDTAETLGRMRSMAQNLRPPILDTLDLRSALENYCMEFSARMHIVLNFEAEQNIPAISDVHSITLYRFLQEALTNVARHARASRVWVDLSVEGNELSLTVQDNGAGFNATADRYGIGIVGLQERMSLVGGSLLINSTPGRGTIITARVPLRMEEL
jgi:signal transduction histidine kinase